jgi:DNA-binding response OmpR family regulator
MDVLLVDDDIDIRTTLAELLQDEGYETGELADSSRLLETLDRYRPLLVLLDLTLPGESLATVLTQARHRGVLDGTVVLALSGLEDACEISLALGLDGHIQKPCEMSVLLDRVNWICRPQTVPGLAGQSRPVPWRPSNF